MPINERPRGVQQVVACPSLDERYRSASYNRMLEELRAIAPDATASVVLEGESGTGKTRLAQGIHEYSPRALGPFCPAVLTAVDDHFVSTYLFGHVVGAFTGAHEKRAGAFVSANNGTLFLDEIGKASPAVQHRLLYAIEAHRIQPVGSDREVHVDVRIVAATSVPLKDLVEAGLLLPDLFARLKLFRVRIPPLRERRDDIPDLVFTILAHWASRLGYARVPIVDNDLMTAFYRAPWHDNLRELDATIHRLLLEAHGADTLSLDLCQGYVYAELFAQDRGDAALTDDVVARALANTRGNKTEAARRLGVDRTTLHRFIARSIARKTREA